MRDRWAKRRALRPQQHIPYPNPTHTPQQHERCPDVLMKTHTATHHRGQTATQLKAPTKEEFVRLTRISTAGKCVERNTIIGEGGETVCP